MPWLTRFELISRGLIPKDGFTWSNRTSQCFWAQPAQFTPMPTLPTLPTRSWSSMPIISATSISVLCSNSIAPTKTRLPWFCSAPNPRGCGIAQLDAVGRIVSFIEKPEQPATDLANAGLYVIEASAYREIAALRAFDLGFDVLPRFVGRMRGWVWGGYHLDIGSHSALERARVDAVRIFSADAIPGHRNFTRRFFLTVTALLSNTSITSPTRPMSGSYLVRRGAHATPPYRFRLCVGDQPVCDWPGHDHRGSAA